MQREAQAVAIMKEMWRITDESYGVRRIHSELRERGVRASRVKIRTWTQKNGLISIQERRFKKTTNSNHGLGYSPNLLEQNFKVEAPNAAWCGDITYVWTSEGWSYLAVVIDLYSRRVVGWSVDKQMKADLVTRAMERAIKDRRPKPGLIFHSDRGSQYASKTFRRLL